MSKIKKQPLVWTLNWDVLFSAENPNIDPRKIYKGDANRLFAGNAIPRNWSVTFTVQGQIRTGIDAGKTIKRSYSHRPDAKLFLGELMRVVQQHVDECIWDECSDLNVTEIHALAVTKREHR